MLVADDCVIEIPSLLVRKTAVELRALDHVDTYPATGDPREREAITVGLDVDVPTPCSTWFPVGLRYEGDDGFLVDLCVGHAGQAIRQHTHGETLRVEPEIWRHQPPHFVACRLSVIARQRRVAYAFGGIPSTVVFGDNLVLRIVVPAAAKDEAVFALRIAYRILEPEIHYGPGCPGFPTGHL